MLGLAHPRHGVAVARGSAGVLVLSAALWGWTLEGTHEPGETDGSPATSATPSSSTPPAEDAELRRPPPRPRPRPRPVLALPREPTTVVAADDPAGQAAAASALLFTRAPIVVLAADGDAEAQSRAAAAAVELGVPLLLTPPIPPGGGAVGSGGAGVPARGAAASRSAAPTVASAATADELARLSPDAVLAVDPAALDWARQLDGDTTVVAASTAGPAAGTPTDGRSGIGDGVGADPTSDDPPHGRPPNRLPPLDPAVRVGDVVVLADRATAAGSGTAAVATARAAGARVVAVAGPDPRADREAIAALAAEPLPTHVVALGSAFGPAERLRPRVEVASTGVELPGGGQVVFPARRLVALYGHPGAPVLGSLGEQPVDAAVARAQQTAAGYAGLVAEPVVPAFEIITTVASAGPGPDGNYSAESTVADLRPWVDAARRAGVYVVLDLQPGHTDFLTQAQRYAELLTEPHVGLALDPEWRLAPGQRHMAQIGSVDAAEVNAVAAWLARLTRERRLPQKLLLLHQFQTRMIANRATVETGHDELAVLVHADGFGTPGQKLDTWRALRAEPLANAWWGWKNFIDEDQPMFSPAETVAVAPSPWFVSYQ